MHKFKGSARRSAWYAEDGEPSTSKWNPYRKNRAPRSRGDLENLRGAPTNYSETLAPSSAETARQAARQSFTSPQHANTMPQRSTDDPVSLQPPTAGDDDRNEKSQDSGAATSETVVADEKPRRRLGFLKKFSHHTGGEKGNEDLSRTSTEKSKRRKQHFTFMSQIKATLFNSWINVLLIFVPIGIAVHFADIGPVGIFVINFIAIIPLAAMLSYATEEIAIYTGETLGGLLNATFGNAVELIVSIIALVKNEIVIVQTSLIGSMLSNLLLVMGMCFFLGGINRLEQNFNVTVAQTASSLLALAVASLVIPTAFEVWSSGNAGDNQLHITELSRGTSILLLLVYASYLYFQLKTHADMYNEPSKKNEKRKTAKVEEGRSIKNMVNVGASLSGTTGAVSDGHPRDTVMDDPEEEDAEDEPQLSKITAIVTLAISTAFVGICAEFLVSSIDALTDESKGGHINKTFVGLILLPIVGNAAEHATAVTVAIKDKMDLAIGVAVGSSMQIALLLIPFMVVLGWILDKPTMDLGFDGFQIAILFVSVLLVNYLIQDGKSHWLEGNLLITLYLIIAVAAWYYPPTPEQQTSEA